MRNYVQVLGLAMAVAAVGSLSVPRAATAADSMMKMDCKSAGSMMATMTPPPMAMKPTVDKEFMNMMVVHDKMAMQMAKVESQCGKDPKTRAMAAKMAEELQLEINRMLPYL